jgi:protein-disulfide isomerase
MTNRPEGDARESRNQRRAAARMRAQKARVQQKRRQKRTRLFLQGGLVVALLAVVAVVTLVLVDSTRPAGPGPANTADGGITIGKDLKAIRTGGTASASTEPAATGTATSAADTVKISLYVDYLCPICGSFEKTNSSYIEGLVDSGAATVDIHPVAILSNRSQGTKYSLRAANAAACVANSSPDQFFAVNRSLFAKQPEEGTAGLDDAALISIVTGTKGIQKAPTITRCIQDQKYAKWVDAETSKVRDDGIPNSKVSFTGTPTVLVNGKKYDYTTPFTNSEFRTFVVTAAGSSFASGDESATPTASPSATPTKQ